MVRNMIGTLIEVGKGNLRVPDIPRIIDAKDRTVAGPSAPSKGLWLVEVEY
jgi:tRNA pseudouridine38-40 synthase